jgi:hypothetical protein
MRRIQTTVAALCAALALTAGAASAQTIPADRTTYVTFSGPVSIPGMTLPAGTYTFRLLNSDTNRNIVQIFDREGMKLYTTLLAIPATRPEPSGDPVITFKVTPSDRPPAVRYWYYAGDTAGNELVYPRAQAMLIAKTSGEGVMSVDSDGTTIDDWRSGSMSRVTGTETQTATSSQTSQTTTSTSTATTTSTDTTSRPPQQPTTPPATTPEQPPVTAQPQPTPPSQPTTMPEQPAPTTAAPATPTVPPPSATDSDRPVGTSGSLPNTASELPLVALIGLLALAGALAIRAARTA